MLKSKIQSDPSVKLAFLEALTMLLYSNQKTSEDKRINIAKETFATVPLVIYSKQNFWLLDTINKKIQLFKAAGLIKFWFQKFVDTDTLKVVKTTSPKVLEIHQFQGCIIVLLVGLAFSFLVFLLEKSLPLRYSQPFQ